MDETGTHVDGATGRTDASPGREDVPPAVCPTTEDGDHPASGLLELLGRAHAIRTLYTVVHGGERRGAPWRFSELEAELDISPNTLSARLDEFEAAGLITQVQGGSPRLEPWEESDKARNKPREMAV